MLLNVVRISDINEATAQHSRWDTENHKNRAPYVV